MNTQEWRDQSSAGPLFIAEVSSNHHRDLNRCFDFIDAAHSIGCHAVKFQLFRIEELFAPEILERSETHRKRKNWELPVEFLPKLAQRTHELGMKFSCTPFYLEAVDELEAYVDFYKVASYELLWDGLLAACAQTGKPVILSTGMATLSEIDHALNVLHSNGCKEVGLLHCVSSYPAPPSQMNLAAIKTLRDTFHVPTGLSDHSVSPPVIQRAVHHFDASYVEFHLDIDRKGEEFDAGHCWLPDQMHQVINDITTALQTDGDGTKEPRISEQNEREWRADPIDGLRPLRHMRDWRPS